MRYTRRSYLRVLGGTTAAAIPSSDAIVSDAAATQSGSVSYERFVDNGREGAFEAVTKTGDGLVAAGTAFEGSEPTDLGGGGDLLVARIRPEEEMVDSVVVSVDEQVRVADVVATDNEFVVVGSVVEDRSTAPAIVAYRFQSLDRVRARIRTPNHPDQSRPQLLQARALGDRLVLFWNVDAQSERFALVVEVCTPDGTRVARAFYPWLQYASAFVADGTLSLTAYDYEAEVNRIRRVDPDTASLVDGPELPLERVPPEAYSAFTPTDDGYFGVTWSEDGWVGQFYDDERRPCGSDLSFDPGLERGRTIVRDIAALDRGALLLLNEVVDHGEGPWSNWLGRFTREDGLVWERVLGGGETNWLGLDVLPGDGESYHLVGTRGRYDGWVLGADGPPDHSASIGSTPTDSHGQTVTVRGKPVTLGDDVTRIEKTVSSPYGPRTPRSPAGAGNGSGDSEVASNTDTSGDWPVDVVTGNVLTAGVALAARQWLRGGDESG